MKPTNIKPEQLCYSPNEAAEQLSIGRTTLFALIKEGRLRVIKLGRRTLVPASALAALIQSELERSERAAA